MKTEKTHYETLLANKWAETNGSPHRDWDHEKRRGQKYFWASLALIPVGVIWGFSILKNIDDIVGYGIRSEQASHSASCASVAGCIFIVAYLMKKLAWSGDGHPFGRGWVWEEFINERSNLIRDFGVEAKDANLSGLSDESISSRVNDVLTKLAYQIVKKQEMGFLYDAEQDRRKFRELHDSAMKFTGLARQSRDSYFPAKA